MLAALEAPASSALRTQVLTAATIRSSSSVRSKAAAWTAEGEIRATGRVELRDGSNVLGDVCTAHLSMEEGATMRGSVDPARADQPFPEETGGSTTHLT